MDPSADNPHAPRSHSGNVSRGGTQHRLRPRRELRCSRSAWRTSFIWRGQGACLGRHVSTNRGDCCTPQIRISRLLTGSPGHVLEPIRFDGHEQLAALLDQVARQGLARAKTHMENRFDREKRFLKVWLDLRSRTIHESAFFNSFRELISPERIKEIITSPTHFVRATVDELSAIKRCLGRVPSQDAPNDESVRDTHLTAASVQSLLDAQAVRTSGLEDCYALVRLAEEQFCKA